MAVIVTLGRHPEEECVLRDGCPMVNKESTKGSELSRRVGKR